MTRKRRENPRGSGYAEAKGGVSVASVMEG